MKISYLVADPTKNITILVTSAVPVESQPATALALLKAESSGEQVGYISEEQTEDYDIVLRMAGGEFCGNATMSTAAYYVSRNRDKLVPTGDDSALGAEVSVRASGCDAPVKCRIFEMLQDTYRGTVEMPAPRDITYAELEWQGTAYKLPLVSFAGISHLIFFGELPHNEAEEALSKWKKDLCVSDLGVMFLDLEAMSVTPLVSVTNPDTVYWESSCGSGTTAVGAYLRHKSGKDISVEVSEPGGSLRIETRESDGRVAYFLTGTVKLGSLQSCETGSE